MKSWTLNILVLLITVSAVSCGIFNYFNLPEVHFNSNNECVRVINYSNTHYTCENLPKKYLVYYVK